MATPVDFSDIATRGLVIVGCGKMGSALLAGWLDQGLPPAAIWVQDPVPTDWVSGTGVHVNAQLPQAPAVVLIAVKPQMMDDVLPVLTSFGPATLFVTVAAGTTISKYQTILGSVPIVRAMPNTPAAIGRGITAIVGNADATTAHLETTEALLSAVGQVVRLGSEDQMDAVTAISGSGPAYVFHLIETLAAAGAAEGLSPDLAMALAKATVGGAGQLAEDAEDAPDQLRVNVTSPGGTTQAALEVLMDPGAGFPDLMRRAVRAAADRSRELGG